MNARALDLAPRRIAKRCKGQAMVEFLMMGAIAMIVLFVAIQLAALGREYMALGELNYQVTRWATNLGNNSIVGQNSPQCADVKNLIHGDSVTPYAAVPKVATGYMGKLANAGVACQSSPPTGGIAVAMACTAAPSPPTSPAVPPYNSGQCATRRAAGTGVQITLVMDTSTILFLGNSFLGVPFPKTLSSSHVMLTQ
jgi:hypothetical protein